MRKLLLFVLVISAFASCKKDGPKPPSITGITLAKDTVKMDVGNSRTLSFTTAPADYDKTKLVWKSSDNSIVSVDNTGALTAKDEGTAIVTVTNSTATITSVCLVTVLPQLKAIALAKDTIAMNAGDVKTIGVTLTPTNYDKTALVWKSSDTTLLSVNKSGVMTAKKEGDVIVSVSNEDATITKFCLVSISPKIDDLTIGLIAYYPFNNSGLDQSGHGNNGTVYNISTVPDRHGNLNAAYHFDGVSSYITVPDKPELRLSNTDFTLSAWIKLETYNTQYGSVIFGKRFTGANNGWTMTVQGQLANPVGSINFGPGGGSTNAVGNATIGLNQWVMVTCVYKFATQQLSIYVNGVLDVTRSNILPANSAINALMYIGKDDPSVPQNGYFFQGSLDEMRIYNRAINTTEITNLFTNY